MIEEFMKILDDFEMLTQDVMDSQLNTYEGLENDEFSTGIDCG